MLSSLAKIKVIINPYFHADGATGPGVSNYRKYLWGLIPNKYFNDYPNQSPMQSLCISHRENTEAQTLRLTHLMLLFYRGRNASH